MYMKRRLLSLMLVALLLPLTGLAKPQFYSVAQVREQAAQGWQQTYTAHGRTIKVDILPQVPKVETFPMLQVGRLPLPIALPQETGWSIHPNVKKGMEEDPSYFSYTMESVGEVPKVINGKKVKYGPFRIYYSENFDPDGHYIPGSEVTFREITDLLRQTLIKVGLNPDIIDVERPNELNAHANYGGSKTEFLAPGWGFFSYYQHMRGIPIHMFGLPAATDHKNSAPSAHFSFSFHRLESFSFGGHLLTEQQVLAEDVPLASFEQVIQALEGEIKAGRLRHVFELKLCYAPAFPPGYKTKEYWQNKDIPGFLVPVWVADVLWVSSSTREVDLPWEEPGGYEAPDARNTLSYRRLMVNAQTGKLYDPQSTDKNRGFYEGFLSWNEENKK